MQHSVSGPLKVKKNTNKKWEELGGGVKFREYNQNFKV